MSTSKGSNNILSTNVIGNSSTRGGSHINYKHSSPTTKPEVVRRTECGTTYVRNHLESPTRKSELRRTEYKPSGLTSSTINPSMYSSHAPTVTTSGPSYKSSNIRQQGALNKNILSTNISKGSYYSHQTDNNVTKYVSTDNYNPINTRVRKSNGCETVVSKNSCYSGRNVSSYNYPRTEMQVSSHHGSNQTDASTNYGYSSRQSTKPITSSGLVKNNGNILASNIKGSIRKEGAQPLVMSNRVSTDFQHKGMFVRNNKTVSNAFNGHYSGNENPVRQSTSFALNNNQSMRIPTNAKRIGKLSELKSKTKTDGSYNCIGKTIIYEGKRHEIKEGESFLEAFSRIKGEKFVDVEKTETPKEHEIEASKEHENGSPKEHEIEASKEHENGSPKKDASEKDISSPRNDAAEKNETQEKNDETEKNKSVDTPKPCSKKSSVMTPEKPSNDKVEEPVHTQEDKALAELKATELLPLDDKEEMLFNFTDYFFLKLKDSKKSGKEIQNMIDEKFEAQDPEVKQKFLDVFLAAFNSRNLKDSYACKKEATYYKTNQLKNNGMTMAYNIGITKSQDMSDSEDDLETKEFVMNIGIKFEIWKIDDNKIIVDAADFDY